MCLLASFCGGRSRGLFSWKFLVATGGKQQVEIKLSSGKLCLNIDYLLYEEMKVKDWLVNNATATEEEICFGKIQSFY